MNDIKNHLNIVYSTSLQSPENIHLNIKYKKGRRGMISNETVFHKVQNDTIINHIYHTAFNTEQYHTAKSVIKGPK